MKSLDLMLQVKCLKEKIPIRNHIHLSMQMVSLMLGRFVSLFFLCLMMHFLSNCLLSTTNFQRIKPGEPYFTTYDNVRGKSFSQKLKGSEAVTVDYVAVDVKNKKQLQKVFSQIFNHIFFVVMV